jgi:hypothetical protein
MYTLHEQYYTLGPQGDHFSKVCVASDKETAKHKIFLQFDVKMPNSKKYFFSKYPPIQTPIFWALPQNSKYGFLHLRSPKRYMMCL